MTTGAKTSECSEVFAVVRNIGRAGMGFGFGSIIDAWYDARRVVLERYFDTRDEVALRYHALRDMIRTHKPTSRIEYIEPPITRVPEGVTVYAIGDVHGRADLLRKLTDMILEDASRQEDPNHRHAVVFLGDYIDRGFQSREVIDLLVSDVFNGFETRFLKGNHEEALQTFLIDSSMGPKWANFGGIETLVSYNVQPPRSRESLEEWERARQSLVQQMPDLHRDFLDNLELCLVLGDYAFVHAGLRPGRPLEEQSESDLLWIRDEFLNDSRPFENIVVHGHTPIDTPHRDYRRIGVDTGAYMSGQLSAVRLCGEDVSFLST